jgi:hypothetical protein
MEQSRSFERASTSLQCLPFKKKFYKIVNEKAISSKELCDDPNWEELVFAPFGVDRAESHFRWMIQCGVLRREVDGQGLTNRIRLTPLGSNVVNQWEGEIPRAGIRMRIQENFRRHGRLNL